MFASTNRLEATYRQFEINLWLDEKMLNRTNVQTINSVGGQLESKQSIPRTNLIEIEFISDEGGAINASTSNATHTSSQLAADEKRRRINAEDEAIFDHQ